MLLEFVEPGENSLSTSAAAADKKCTYLIRQKAYSCLAWLFSLLLSLCATTARERKRDWFSGMSYVKVSRSPHVDVFRFVASIPLPLI